MSPAILTVGPSGSIDEVELNGPDEHPRRCSQALPSLREQVLSAQSAEIDGVSGASLTSNAVKDAVSQALAQASGYREGLKGINAAANCG